MGEQKHEKALVFLVTLSCQRWNPDTVQLQGERHLGWLLLRGLMDLAPQLPPLGLRDEIALFRLQGESWERIRNQEYWIHLGAIHKAQVLCRVLVIQWIPAMKQPLWFEQTQMLSTF